AKHHLLDAGDIDAEGFQQASQPLPDDFDQETPKDGNEHRAEPGRDGTKDDVNRAGNVEHLLGKKVVVVECVNNARERCHCGGDDHRDHLVVKRVDSSRARGLFILAYRQPEISDPAFQQRAAKDKGQNRRYQQYIIEHHRMATERPKVVVGVLRDRQEQSGRSVGPPKRVKSDPREFGKRNGENGEIDAGNPKPERKETDKRAGDCRDGDRHEQADPRAEAKMDVQRGRGIGAQSHIKCMAKRQLAGEAHHDVPGLARIRKVQDQNQHGEHVIAGKQWRGEKTDEERAEQEQGARWNSGGEPPDHAVLLPMMPCGRKSRTRTRMAKANMVLAEGVNTRPAIASVSPIRTPPTSAPGIEPRPPVMTITKARNVYAGPAPGVTSKISSSIGPAAPTHAAPSANVSA